MYGLGGGVDDHIFEQMELQSGRCARQGNARGTADYSEFESSSLLPLSTRAGTPLGHTSPCSPNQHQCKWPETPAVKPLWGALYDLKIDLQKKRPLRWSKSGGLCGCMQAAVNRLCEAFWPCCQAHHGSPAPNLHPQSALFCAPKVSVVHQGKQPPVE